MNSEKELTDQLNAADLIISYTDEILHCGGDFLGKMKKIIKLDEMIKLYRSGTSTDTIRSLYYDCEVTICKK